MKGLGSSEEAMFLNSIILFGKALENIIREKSVPLSEKEGCHSARKVILLPFGKGSGMDIGNKQASL